MAKLTFEEAKDAIAKKHGFRDWQDMQFQFFLGDRSEEDSPELDYEKQAAELMANEAVKEDRRQIANNWESWASYAPEFDQAFLNVHDLEKLPLPFPEIENKNTLEQ